MGCYNRKSFLQYNNSNNRGRQHFGWPATDDGPWLPPSMAATTIQRGHLRHVFLLRMIANRLEGGMDTLAAATTSIVWDGLLQQQIVPAIQQQQQQREAAFVMASHRRWSMAATTIQRGYLRHVFLRKIDATIHSCIQQHCLAHTSAHIRLTALGNANGASPLFGIANDNGTYPITGIANANRVLWGEYMASPLFGIGNGIASANSSCICTSDSFWK